MKKISPDGETYEFIDGDVYVVDNGNEIYIWRGKDCGVDEQTVGAWVANKLDNTDRGGEPSVVSLKQGEETEEFKKLLSINVVDGDTPGFLKAAELDMVEYKLFRVYTKEETATLDEAFVEEVPMEKSSLNSKDVYFLDGNESLFLWIGSGANREEKFEGQKFMQKVDSGRSYLPLQYTIYEGEGGKSENAFYELIKMAKSSGAVVSVEDQRELKYKPEGSQTAEEHKVEAKDVDSRKKVETPAKSPKKSKGFWSRLKFW